MSTVQIACRHALIYLQLVDGWEAKGEFFPGEWDAVKPMDERYRTYCGRDVPLRFRSSQNVALIQHRIPVRAQGFSFTVRFVHNKRRKHRLTPPETLYQETVHSYTLRISRIRPPLLLCTKPYLRHFLRCKQLHRYN